jgi:translation initiation factor 2B subunit (eIF-2B alpha/beta/delta family)
MSTDDESSDETKALLERLRPDRSVAERLSAFAELGLETAQVRDAASVSAETLRLWAKERPVSQTNRAIIDNIGQAGTILLVGLGGRADTVRWLTTPHGQALPPPLELIRDQPKAVLAAAAAHVAGRAEEAQELLEQAVTSHNRIGELPDTPLTESSDWSSTQLKRLLLARLHELTANHISGRDAMQQLDAQRVPELAHLPNYEAYNQFMDEVIKKLADADEEPAETAISDLLASASAEEAHLRKELTQVARELVGARCRSILTYSMSVRVIQALWGVEEERQAGCTLYVAEGRVKSIPQAGTLPAFADAAEILRFLASTRYDRYVVPDAIASSLVVQNKVDLVLLGAQKVFVDAAEEPTHFVATAGTDAILRAARDAGVKVRVLAERRKISHDEPEVKPREKVVPLNLPGAGDGVDRYARLFTISAELCDVRVSRSGDDEDAVGEQSIVCLVGDRPLVAT